MKKIKLEFFAIITCLFTIFFGCTTIKETSRNIDAVLSLVVAKNYIPKGSKIEIDDITALRVPSVLSENGVPWLRRNEIIGKNAKSDINPGEVFDRSYLTE